jgi:hypothetical protein
MCELTALARCHPDGPLDRGFGPIHDGRTTPHLVQGFATPGGPIESTRGCWPSCPAGIWCRRPSPEIGAVLGYTIAAAIGDIAQFPDGEETGRLNTLGDTSSLRLSPCRRIQSLLHRRVSWA